MKNSARFLALILALIMCAFVFAACNNSSSDESKTPETNSSPSADTNSQAGVDESKWKDEDGNYSTGLTKADLEGGKDTFTILCRGNRETTYQCVDFTSGEDNTVDFYGAYMDDAVDQRREKVLEDFGVTIKAFKTDDDYITVVKQEATSGDGAFDAVLINTASLATLAADNYLVDLKSLDNMMLNAPWWDQKANEAFDMGGKLYFTTGDITTLNKISTMGVIFNKKLFDDYGLDYPYVYVKDETGSNGWTLDKMMELAKVVPESEDSEIHGLLTGYNDCDDLYICLGGTYTEKDGDGMIKLAIDNSHNINVGTTLLSAFKDRGNFILFAQECPVGSYSNIWDASFAEFYEGRVLMRVSGFSAANKMRKYQQVDFGIVPAPKLNNEQETYKAAAGTMAYVGILKANTTDEQKEWVAKMLNITAASGKNYGSKAYYETCLRTLSLRDDASEEMLDIIFDNLYYDLGLAFNFGKSVGVIQDLCGQRLDSFQSGIAGVVDAAQADLESKVFPLYD